MIWNKIEEAPSNTYVLLKYRRIKGKTTHVTEAVKEFTDVWVDSLGSIIVQNTKQGNKALAWAHIPPTIEELNLPDVSSLNFSDLKVGDVVWIENLYSQHTITKIDSNFITTNTCIFDSPKLYHTIRKSELIFRSKEDLEAYRFKSKLEKIKQDYDELIEESKLWKK